MTTHRMFEICGAHTLLGTVRRLFIPASVHLNMDKPVADLLWQSKKAASFKLIPADVMPKPITYDGSSFVP